MDISKTFDWGQILKGDSLCLVWAEAGMIRSCVPVSAHLNDKNLIPTDKVWWMTIFIVKHKIISYMYAANFNWQLIFFI